MAICDEGRGAACVSAPRAGLSASVPSFLRGRARVGRKKHLVQHFMHFSFYWMIAALVVLSIQVAYALYQLANLFL